MRLYQVLLGFILLTLINGCSLIEPKVVYIQTPCAKLQEWNIEPLDENITYEVYDDQNI